MNNDLNFKEQLLAGSSPTSTDGAKKLMVEQLPRYLEES